MNFEVERKFSVDDAARLEGKLAELGAKLGEAEMQADTYFSHPARDFAQTDEALRIRRTDNEYFVTYKGPKIDATTKTRRELELPLDSQSAAAGQYASLLEALGFRRVAEVRKRRRKATLAWQGHAVEAALDNVEGLGTFAELETSAARESDLDAARKCLADLALKLGLDRDERRSYLELLLAR